MKHEQPALFLRTAPILFLCFMQKLGIKEVIPVNVNLDDGVLVDPELW